MASAGGAALNASAVLAKNVTGANATALAFDDEEDRVDPAWAILLLYAFLVRAGGGEGGGRARSSWAPAGGQA
jgi:hypothetical protein